MMMFRRVGRGIGVRGICSVGCDTEINLKARLLGESITRKGGWDGEGMMIVFTTPDYAMELTGVLSGISSNKNIVACCVDYIAGYNTRSISRLWVNNNQQQEVKVCSETRARATASARKWTMMERLVWIKFKHHKIGIPLANTLFTGSYEYTAVMEGGAQLVSDDLKSIEIDLSLVADPVVLNTHNDSLKPLDTGGIITGSKGNIIKSIDNQPASLYLNKLVNSKSKAITVYGLINHNHRVKVIAGGGEYGSKAGFLVLDPQSIHHQHQHLQDGSRIDFYYQKDYYNLLPLQQDSSPLPNPHFVFSTLPQSMSMQQTVVGTSTTPAPPSKFIKNLFTASTESINGIRLDSNKLDAPGDVLDVSTLPTNRGG